VVSNTISRRHPEGVATPGRDETDRVVAPYGLVFHAANWYLAADDERSGEIRTFLMAMDETRALEVRPHAAGG
jgi:WYL domain